MNDLVKNLLLWAMVAVVLMLVFNSFNPGTGATSEVRYSQFMEQVRRDQIKSVKIAEDEKSIEFVTKGGESGTVIAPRRDEGMMDDLINHKVEIQAAPPSSGPSFIYILINLLLGWLSQWLERQLRTRRPGVRVVKIDAAAQTDLMAARQQIEVLEEPGIDEFKKP